jgi:hypothetical protein
MHNQSEQISRSSAKTKHPLRTLFLFASHDVKLVEQEVNRLKKVCSKRWPIFTQKAHEKFVPEEVM